MQIITLHLRKYFLEICFKIFTCISLSVYNPHTLSIKKKEKKFLSYFWLVFWNISQKLTSNWIFVPSIISTSCIKLKFTFYITYSLKLQNYLPEFFILLSESITNSSNAITNTTTNFKWDFCFSFLLFGTKSQG